MYIGAQSSGHQLIDKSNTEKIKLKRVEIGGAREIVVWLVELPLRLPASLLPKSTTSVQPNCLLHSKNSFNKGTSSPRSLAALILITLTALLLLIQQSATCAPLAPNHHRHHRATNRHHHHEHDQNIQQPPSKNNQNARLHKPTSDDGANLLAPATHHHAETPQQTNATTPLYDRTSAPVPAQPAPREPELNAESTTGFGDDFVHNENWFESTYARHAIAQYVFSEWYEKNLTDSLSDNSTADLFGDSLDSGPSLHSFVGPSSSFINASTSASSSGGGPIGSNTGHALLGLHNGTSTAASAGGHTTGPRPYFGDAFYSFQTVYWPIHCVICLVICTLGIFANVTNIVVLTRPNMITAVNTILSAMAFSDLIVNITNIPYLLHELSDQTNFTSFFSFQWALYILFQAHTTVTAHTISIWLTCVLSTWRYFVVCRSQSSNQRNWSVGLAKRTIIGVFLIVPVFCIPNYLSFAIVKEVTESNSTIYKVGFSHLADESQFIKTFHFWIFSCLTKLVPCVLLTFFTTVLIRKLLKARERRLRLATYGSRIGKDLDGDNKLPISNGDSQRLNNNNFKPGKSILINEANHNTIYSENNQRNSDLGQNKINLDEEVMSNGEKSNKNPTRGTLALHSGSSCATDGEMVVTSCDSSGNGNEPTIGIGPQQPRILSQLIVESAANSTTTISTTKAPIRLMASTCDICNDQQLASLCDHDNSLCPSRTQRESPRSASTCGALELYGNQSLDCKSMDNQIAVESSKTASQDMSGLKSGRRSFVGRTVMCSAINPIIDGDMKFTQDKRASEILLSSRGRSTGSTTLAPFQMVKLQAAQRQISQNETTTRLLIAVMIVFLICEFPAGILAALCAILGQDFFENVYQPTGILTDLLALINSSVNFMIYCFMSTQFRITFYRVILHCPAPQTQPK